MGGVRFLCTAECLFERRELVLFDTFSISGVSSVRKAGPSVSADQVIDVGTLTTSVRIAAPDAPEDAPFYQT